MTMSRNEAVQAGFDRVMHGLEEAA